MLVHVLTILEGTNYAAASPDVWTDGMEKIGIWSGALVAACGFLWGAFRVLRRCVSKYHDLSVKVVRSYEKVEQMANLHDVIIKEFRPNGGSSLRDVVNRIEARIIKEEQYNKAITNHMKLPVFASDPDGSCVWVNDAMLGLVGRGIGDFVGNNWKGVIDEDDADRVYEEWSTSVREQREFDELYCFRDIFGHRILVRAKSKPYYDTNTPAKLLGFVGSCTPLTEDDEDYHKYYQTKKNT
jgi:PAS domain S-box-containing protein